MFSVLGMTRSQYQILEDHSISLHLKVSCLLQDPNLNNL